MLSDEAEFFECVDDIKEECARFGTIVSCVAPRKGGDLHGLSESDVGSVFLEYTLVDEARKAHAALDGRPFDGQAVKATFLPA